MSADFAAQILKASPTAQKGAVKPDRSNARNGLIALVRCTLATPGTPPGRIDEIEFGSIYVSMVGLESDCGELPPDAQPATSRVVKSCLVNARRTVRRAAVSPAVTTMKRRFPVAVPHASIFRAGRMAGLVERLARSP
jgi:hypothetical protein